MALGMGKGEQSLKAVWPQGDLLGGSLAVTLKILDKAKTPGFLIPTRGYFPPTQDLRGHLV